MVSRKYLCSRFSFLTARGVWLQGGGGRATTNTLDTCRISLFDPLRSQGYFSDIDDDDGGDYYKKTNCQADPGYYSIQKLRSPTILSKRFATCQVNQSISQSFRISNSWSLRRRYGLQDVTWIPINVSMHWYVKPAKLMKLVKPGKLETARQNFSENGVFCPKSTVFLANFKQIFP